MAWWPFGRRRRKNKRPQSAEPPPPSEIREKPVQVRSYTAPVSAAPSISGDEQDDRQPSSTPRLNEKSDISPSSKRGNKPTAMAVDNESKLRARDSDEDLTALPKSKGIEHSPHLRPIPEAAMNSRSQRSADEKALRRSQTSKKRKENKERAEQLRAMTEPIPIPNTKKQAEASTFDANFSFLSRSFSRKSRRKTAKPVAEQLQQGSIASLPKVSSGRSSMTAGSAERNRFEFGSIGILSPRPQLRFSIGSPGGINRSAAPSRTASALEKHSPIGRHVLKESKTIDEFADDLDARTLRELMERDQRRRDKRASRESEKAKKKLDKVAGKKRRSPSPSSRQAPPSTTETRLAGSDVDLTSRVREPDTSADVEKANVFHDSLELGDDELNLSGPATRDITQKADDSSSALAGARLIGDSGEDEDEDDHKIEESTVTRPSNLEGDPFVDPPAAVKQGGEDERNPEEGVAAEENSTHPDPIPAVAHSPSLSATSETANLMSATITDSKDIISIPYESSAFSSPSVSAHDMRRASNLSQPTDGRATPVEELNRSNSRNSIRGSGALSALFRRSGTGKRRSQDLASSEISFSNTSRESMSRQAPPAHLVRETSSPDSSIRRRSGVVRTRSRFREDLPEYTPPPPEDTESAASPPALPTRINPGMELPERQIIERVEEESAFPPPPPSPPLPPPVPEKSMMRSKSHSFNSQHRNTVLLRTPPAKEVTDPMPVAVAVAVAAAAMAAKPSGIENPEPTSPILPQSLASVDSEASWLTGRPNRRASQRTSREQSTPSSPVRDRIAEEGAFNEVELSSAMVTPRARRPKSPINRISASLEDEDDDGAVTPQAQAGQPATLEQIVHGSIARSPTVVYHQTRVKSNEGLLHEFDDEYEHETAAGADDTLDENEISTTEYAASSHLGSTQYDTASEGYGTEVEETETSDAIDLPVSYGIQHARTASAGSARILDITTRHASNLQKTHSRNESEVTARAPSPL